MTRLHPSRRQVLCGAAAAALLPLPARAQASRFNFAPTEVADGIWMIEGAKEVFSRSNGGAIVNIAFIQTPQGAVVVDTGSNIAMGREIRAFAEQRLGGVALVVNTHHHPDHWFGNAAFEDRQIVALEPTIEACTQYAQDFSESLYAILGSWMTGTNTHPANGPLQGGEARIGGRAMQFIALSGHTQADMAIMDQQTGTLIAGDLLFLDRAPSLPDADFTAWNAALTDLEALGPSGTVPGHGPFDTAGAALTQTRAYLAATKARLDRAAAFGLSPVETMSAGPVPEFAGLGANPEEYLRSVVQRWADHETEALPLIGGL